MENYKLTANKREVPTPAVNQARQEGKVTVELYGSGSENQHLFLKTQEVEKVYQQAGESNLIDLIIDGAEPIKVIIQDIQQHPLSDKISHVDLYKVQMDKAITTHIPLNFVGEAKAIKELGGTLVQSLEELEISCLPGDLIDHIDVDISVLNTFNDIITVADLNVPQIITVETDLGFNVVSVVAPKLQQEEAPATETAEGEAAKEGEKEGKKEEGKAEDKKE